MLPLQFDVLNRGFIAFECGQFIYQDLIAAGLPDKGLGAARHIRHGIHPGLEAKQMAGKRAMQRRLQRLKVLACFNAGEGEGRNLPRCDVPIDQQDRRCIVSDSCGIRREWRFGRRNWNGRNATPVLISNR